MTETADLHLDAANEHGVLKQLNEELNEGIRLTKGTYLWPLWGVRNNHNACRWAHLTSSPSNA